MAGDVQLQLNTADAAELAYVEQRVRMRAERRRELWRWLMSSKQGRELLYEIWLPELGYLRHIGGPLEQVYSQAALHNLCCRLMAEDVLPNREFYLQMQGEALKREEQERRELEAMRVKWASRDNNDTE